MCREEEYQIFYALFPKILFQYIWLYKSSTPQSSLPACQYALFIVLRAFQKLWNEGFCLCVKPFMYYFLQLTIICELLTIQCLLEGFKQIRITRNLVWSESWMVENLPISCLKVGHFMWSSIMIFNVTKEHPVTVCVLCEWLVTIYFAACRNIILLLLSSHVCNVLADNAQR
jgi:hypothetical protein